MSQGDKNLNHEYQKWVLHLNQYDIVRRGCALMSSLHKANWDGQAGRRTGGRAQVSIGMHAHPTMQTYRLVLSQTIINSPKHMS
jgi:hypothetical protein